jgi:diamine N-acetyltransferase
MFELRAVEQDDLEFLRTLRNHPDMNRWLNSPSLPLSQAQQERWFQALLDKRNQAILIAWHGDQRVGYGQLHPIDDVNRAVEIGCHIAPEHQGQGFGTRLMEALLQIIFVKLGLHRAYLVVMASNDAARHLYKKCGLVEDGRLRHAVWKDGRFEDLIYMSILENEFFTRYEHDNK